MTLTRAVRGVEGRSDPPSTPPGGGGGGAGAETPT